jgi:PIN domain nuclease of toxin-antitoxin system
MGRTAVILVDTHVVIWLALDPVKLSRPAQLAISAARQSGEAVAISDISLLEIATLCTKGRVRLSITVEAFLREIEERFTILPITALACARLASFPAEFPGDPADRIIGATALVHGTSLVTADREIRRTQVVATIW